MELQFISPLLVRSDYDSEVREAAERHGIDPDLAVAVHRQEYNPTRWVSPAGARGPMQLMPGTARDLGVDPDDALQNIDGGVRYLKEQIETFPSVSLALAAYNAGPERVRRAGGIPNIAETQDYVRDVTARLKGGRSASFFSLREANAAEIPKDEYEYIGPITTEEDSGTISGSLSNAKPGDDFEYAGPLIEEADGQETRVVRNTGVSGANTALGPLKTSTEQPSASKPSPLQYWATNPAKTIAFSTASGFARGTGAFLDYLADIVEPIAQEKDPEARRQKAEELLSQPPASLDGLVLPDEIPVAAGELDAAIGKFGTAVRDYLRDSAEQEREIARRIDQGNTTRDPYSQWIGETAGGVMPGITQFVLEKYLAPIHGSIKGGVQGSIEEGGERFALGRIFQGLSPYSRPVKAAGMGVAFGGQAAAHGGNPEDVGKAAATGMAFGAIGPGGPVGTMDMLAEFRSSLGRGAAEPVSEIEPAPRHYEEIDMLQPEQAQETALGPELIPVSKSAAESARVFQDRFALDERRKQWEEQTARTDEGMRLLRARLARDQEIYGPEKTAEPPREVESLPFKSAEESARVFEQEGQNEEQLLRSPEGRALLRKRLAEEQAIYGPEEIEAARREIESPPFKSAEESAKVFQRQAQTEEQLLRSPKGRDLLRERLAEEETVHGPEETSRQYDEVPPVPFKSAEESAIALEKQLGREEQLLRSPAGRRLLAERLQAEQQGGRQPVTEIDQQAHEAATSPLNDLHEPTQGQKEAGNYRKGHIKVQGLDIAIENPKGSIRSGIAEDGSTWESTLPEHYGYIRKTEGADGDHVDAYVGPNPDSRKVFIVDQVDPRTGRFDEHKTVIGADGREQAKKIYRAGFSDKSGSQRMGAISEITMDQFKEWLKDGNTSKPFAGSNFDQGSKQAKLTIEPHGRWSLAVKGPDAAIRDQLITSIPGTKPIWNSAVEAWIFPRKQEGKVREALKDLLEPQPAELKEQRPAPISEGLQVKRAKNFHDTGNYDVTLPNGRVVQIYRDTGGGPTAGWWIIDDSKLEAKGPGSAVAGFTKAEAINRVKELYGREPPREFNPGKQNTLPEYYGHIRETEGADGDGTKNTGAEQNLIRKLEAAAGQSRSDGETGDAAKSLDEGMSAKAKPKEPWEMTRKEYIQDRSAAGKKSIMRIARTEEEIERYGATPIDMHRELIERALIEGMPVPSEVLKDYPDIRRASGISSTRSTAPPSEGLQKRISSNLQIENHGKNSIIVTGAEGEQIDRLKSIPGAKPIFNSKAGGYVFSRTKERLVREALADLDSGSIVQMRGGGPSTGEILSGVKRFADMDVIPAAKGIAEGFRTSRDDIKKILSPMSRGEEARFVGETLREKTAEMARKGDVAEAATRKAERYFDRQPAAKRMEFIDNIETGRGQVDPELQEIAVTLRGLLDQRVEDVRALGTGKLKQVIENYFPHIWEDPKKAGDFIADWYRKGPMEGSRAFLKRRSIPSFKEGIEAGLKPVTDNPVTLTRLKLRELDKYVMAHEVLNEAKERGIAKLIRIGESAPAGWAKVDDRIGTVFGKPAVPIKEAFDKRVMEGLNRVADALGISRDRVPSMRGKRWGYQETGGRPEIATRFGGPESVLAHEIGHAIGDRYDVYQSLLRGDRPKAEKKAINEELRKLADLRFEGEEVSPSYRHYVRKGPEKEAVIVEAYVHAPARFKEVAPTVFTWFENLIGKDPKLRGLKDIKPSLVLGSGHAEARTGGLLIHGNYYLPEPAARVINNYLSPGLREKSALFRGYLTTANIMNQVQLGMSAFHLGFTSLDAIISKFSLGILKVTHGDIIGAGEEFLRTPAVPVTNAMTGHKVLKEWFHPGTQSTEIQQIVKAAMAGGARARMDEFYRTNIANNMKKAFREGNVIGAAFRLPFALVELQAKPIMEWIVPRQKMGVFADLVKMEIERNPNMSHEELRARASKIWDSVDNRMGQLVYDNLFWRKTVKDLGMASVRSLGWNLGTWREVGGGVIDTGKAIAKAARLQKPEMTYRMSYVVGLPIVVGTLGAITNLLMTGEAPQDLKDYFFPRTGRLDPNGSPERLSLPSYMKDLYHIAAEPKQTAINKLHPMLHTTAEMLDNRDFYGTRIRSEDDPLVQQGLDLLKHVGKSFEPFASRNIRREVDLAGKFEPTAALPFVGITPAPMSVNKTPAERLISEILRDKMPVGSRTKEDAERSEGKKAAARAFRMGDVARGAEALTELATKGLLKHSDVKDIKERAGLPPLVAGFKHLDAEDAVRVWARTNDDERALLLPFLKKKLESLKNTYPERHSRVLQSLVKTFE